jgi:protein O-mannosyl-transferase
MVQVTEPFRRQNLLVYLVLAAAIAAVYSPVCHYGFISLDDEIYIAGNPHLRGGLTFRELGWAFTTPLDQWMPVTWLARMFQYQLFGPAAGMHHLINVLFHIANSLLLFSVLNRITGARWRSALVAALFALHPLHVESAAWVTGLKDVLSMFFGLLTIWAYVRYTELLNAEHGTSNSEHRTPSPHPSPLAPRPTPIAFYCLTLLFFALALLSKPMVVTLPFVLLLLDYWPLGRTRWVSSAVSDRIKVAPGQLLTEKLPFLALAAVSCLITFWAQRAAGVVPSLGRISLDVRIANVLLSYAGYLGKTIWPIGLAIFYPFNTNPSFAAAMVACVGLAGVTAAAIWSAPRRPWFATGWLWYLGTLVPVIGLVQVGAQSMADRYTYVPLIGLFILLCWSVPSRAIERPIVKMSLGVAVVAALAACAILARIQIGYWKESETLFRHALDVTQDNWLAHNNLGLALGQSGRFQEEIEQYEQALRLKPDLVEAQYNWGIALAQLGRMPEASEHWEQVLQLKPDYCPEVYYNLAVAFEQAGKPKEAIGHYEHALRLNPDYREAKTRLARLQAARTNGNQR